MVVKAVHGVDFCAQRRSLKRQIIFAAAAKNCNIRLQFSDPRISISDLHHRDTGNTLFYPVGIAGNDTGKLHIRIVFQSGDYSAADIAVAGNNYSDFGHDQ